VLIAVLLILSLLAIGLAVLHDANTRRAARHATRNSSPVKQRPGWGPDSKLPPDGLTLES
jgi:hypothetical protein